MNVTKIEGSRLSITESKPMSPKEFRMEINYFKSQEILQKLLKAGLITPYEHDEINKLNMLTYRPLYAHLFP